MKNEQIVTTIHDILTSKLNAVKPGTNWVNQVNVFVSDNVIKIDAPGYTKYLLNGRGPGKRPPMDPIVSWLKRKGLAEKLYWAVSTKIMKEGTKGTGREWYNEAMKEITELVAKETISEAMKKMLRNGNNN